MRATYTGGSGLVGVSNRGLGNEGLYFEGWGEKAGTLIVGERETKEGGRKRQCMQEITVALNRQSTVPAGQKPYEGYFFAKSNGPVQVAVQLRDFSRNKTLASTVIAFAGGNWTMLNFTLTPSTGTQCVDGSQDARVYCGNMGPEPVRNGGDLVVWLLFILTPAPLCISPGPHLCAVRRRDFCWPGRRRHGQL